MSTESNPHHPVDPAGASGGQPAYDDATQRAVLPPASPSGEGLRKENAPRDLSALPAAGLVVEQPETVISKRVPGEGESSNPKSPLRAGSSAELGKALEGMTLGSFHLVEFVGGGGMGAVFRAQDTALGRTVAVKVLSRDCAESEMLRRFQNEAQSAAQLDHHNIARVYHVGQDQGLHFIVFEFIEGVNLRDLVQQHGPLPLSEAVSYTLQVAEALEHAAQRNIVHRDIKPSNVLVTADGHAKLVDMGLARWHNIESQSADLTASGVTLGTFDYISPEQARDPRVADVRSDLYSLGCTLYFMLTGRPPFPQGTVLQKLLSHSSEEPADPREFRPELDEGLVAILRKLLAKQPAQRYREPNELIGALLQLAERLELGGLSQIGRYWVSSRRDAWSAVERQLPWLLPTAVFLVVLLVLSLHARPGNSPPFAPPRLPVPSAAEAAARPLPPSPAGSLPATEPPREAGRGTPRAPQETLRPATEPAGIEPATPPHPAVPTDRPAPHGGAAPEPPRPELPSATPETAAGKTPTPLTEPAGPAAQEPAVSPPATGGAPESKRPPDASPALVPVEYLIVGPPDLVVPANARRFDSLAAACQEANRSGLDTIELHFDGPRLESPVTMAASRLTIRNGPNHRPTLVFRPSREAGVTPRAQIRVSGGRVSWDGVHLRLELPEAGMDGGALFGLERIVSFEIQDTVLTMRDGGRAGRHQGGVTAPGEKPREGAAKRLAANGGPSGARDRRVAAFFEFGFVPVGEASERPSEIVPPYLRLDRCVIRGQAVVLHVPHASALRAVCRHSLVVTTEHLVDVGGMPRKPGPKADPLELELKNVTAAMRLGLGRLSSDEAHPYQLDLASRCENSILYLTDPAAALFERKGAAALEDVSKRWTVSGRDNFYPGSTILLRITPPGATDQPQDFELAARDEIGFDEKSPRTRLIWAVPPDPARSADLHTPGDYLLDESQINPAVGTDGQTRCGVHPGDLPPVGDETAGEGKPAVPPVAAR